MAFQADQATREAIQARLRFYRELGIGEFYRRPVETAWLAELAEPAEAIQSPQAALAAESRSRRGFATAPISDQLPAQPPAIPDLIPNFSSAFEESAIAPRKPFPAPPPQAEPVPPEQHFAALKLIREEIGDCTRCKLHTGRNKLVFGDGDPNARLFFVGEGPGADEDASGLPFVGRGGQLLNNMIQAMGLKREQVYIANVVKCRPPGNRTPEPDEAHTCSPFLFRQIDVVRPKVIVALGQTAVTYLTGEKRPLSAWRGSVHPLRGTKLIVTYHPAFLLRDPNQKKHAWADLQIAMRELGLEPPKRS